MFLIVQNVRNVTFVVTINLCKRATTCSYGFNASSTYNPTMGGGIVLELCHLRTVFGNDKQLFCNGFLNIQNSILFGMAPRCILIKMET